MDFSQLFWIIPITLLIVAIVQSIYWTYLLRTTNAPKRQSRSGTMMPTSPNSTGLAGQAPEDMRDDFADGSKRRGGFQGTMTVLEGIPGTTEIRLPKTSFSLGRFYNPDEDILIALDERSISRRHAYFSTDGNNHYLTDIGSSYGTSIYIKDQYVNLSPDQREQIYNGDVILFGKTVKVQMRLPGPTRP